MYTRYETGSVQEHDDVIRCHVTLNGIEALNTPDASLILFSMSNK